MITRRQFTLTAAAAAATAALPGIATAGLASMERPVTLIVPLPKNGPTEMVANLIAAPLGKALGVPVKVEVISGDWGMTGAKIAAHAKPDGHTLVLGQRSTHAALPVMYNRYNALRDFTPVGMVGVSPMVVLVRRDLPFNNLASLQAYLKASPNRLAISHGGVGSASAFAATALKRSFGVEDLRESIYTGTAAALQRLSDGEADILCDQMISALPAIRAGKVKAIGINSASRTLAMPGVLTGAQQGFANLRASNWHAIFAPKGTPSGTQAWLTSAVNSLLDDPAVTRQMREHGLHVPYTEQRGPAALVDLQQREMQEIMETLNIAVA